MQRLLNRHNEVMQWHASITGHCPECNSTDFIEDSRTGDTICKGCGLSLSERMIDPGKEWRSFDSVDESKRARTGLPSSPTMYDKGLTTIIGRPNNKLSPAQKERAERNIKTHQRNIGNNVVRNLRVAFGIMKLICQHLNIDKGIKDKSTILYRKAVEKGLSRGRPMDALVCATLYAGCKKSNRPRCFEDFEEFVVDVKQIRNCVSLLIDEMEIKIPPASPKDFVERIAMKGCITESAKLKAYKILGAMETLGKMNSRDPRGFVAASLYIGCKASDNNKDRNKTQRDVAVYSGVTEVTVRKRLNDIHKNLKIKMPD